MLDIGFFVIHLQKPMLAKQIIAAGLDLAGVYGFSLNVIALALA